MDPTLYFQPPDGMSKKQLKTWYMEFLGYFPKFWWKSYVNKREGMKMSDLHAAKRGLKAADVQIVDCICTLNNSVPYTIGTLTSTQYHTTDLYQDIMVGPTCKQEEKENTMRLYANGADSETKNFILTRLSTAAATKKTALKTTYGLVDDAAPKTPKELVDRILAGNIVLPKDADDKDRYSYYGIRDMFETIRFRDPKVLEDKDGYKVAADKVDLAVKTTEETIVVLDAQTGLKALQDFEAATFQ